MERSYADASAKGRTYWGFATFVSIPATDRLLDAEVWRYFEEMNVKCGEGWKWRIVAHITEAPISHST